MKVLIAGAGGQLGLALARKFSHAHDVVALDRTQLSITDQRACRDALKSIRPDVLFNCAAYTAVDRAESERDAAFAINRDGAQHLAIAAQDVGCYLVHFSTDYVFDGVAPSASGRPRAYTEDDAASPIGVYGESKLAGERAIASCMDAFAIFRLSWVYSNDGANFYKTMLRLAAERDVLRVVNDQWGVPNFTGELADCMAALLASDDRALFRAPGLYHLSASGKPVSWHAFASEIVARAQLSKPPTVEPIATAEFPTAARRPAWSALDSSRFVTTFGVKVRPWQDGLARCFAERGMSA